jgi:hypothetical protein
MRELSQALATKTTGFRVPSLVSTYGMSISTTNVACQARTLSHQGTHLRGDVQHDGAVDPVSVTRVGTEAKGGDFVP